MNPNEAPTTFENNESVAVSANLLIIFGTTLIAVLGVASITPAFPRMSIELGIPPEMIGLVIIVFTIPGILFTPFLGVAADRFGRRPVLAPALLLFGVAGFACVFSESLSFVLGISPFLVLLVFRFFQGIGAAALGSLNVTTIGDLYKRQQRTQVMGYNVSVQSSGTAIYPAIGGFLALFGWFYPFYLPLIAIPVGLAALFKLEVPGPDENLSLGQYFTQIGTILRNRQVAGLFIVGTTVFIMLYGAIITYLPFLIITSFFVNSFIAGLVISLISIASAIVAPFASRLAHKHSMKYILLAAFPFMALGLFLIPFAPTLFLVLIPVIFFGIGMGFAMPTVQILLVRLAPMNCRAALMSLNGLVLRLGQTLGPLIMAMVLGIWALPSVYWLAALFALVLIPIILVSIPSSAEMQKEY
ncbi:MAG: MFS transporter [Candidatus Hermodarchaeota archaeon]